MTSLDNPINQNGWYLTDYLSFPLYTKEPIIKETYWQDTIKKILYSKGSYLVSLYSIMIVMLYYCYSANPPKPDEISNCSNNLTYTYCSDVCDKLKQGYDRLVGQGVLSLILIGTPHL